MWWKIGKYINHYLKAITIYDLHSPFLYELCSAMLTKHLIEIPPKLALERKKIGQNRNLISLIDFGAGSRSTQQKSLPINKILRIASSSQRKCEQLYRMVTHLKPQKILELGTNLGMATAYMAYAHPKTTLISLEGDPSLVKMARQFHKNLGLHNIQIVEGRFQDTLSEVLQRYQPFDLVFMDGHHLYESTMSYFKNITPYLADEWVICLDDIYWSKGMEQAWREIVHDPLTHASLDWFDFGMIFHNHRFLEKMLLNIVPYHLKPWRCGLFI